MQAGCCAATWQLPDDPGAGKGPVGYNVPGRLASVGTDHRDPARAGAFFVFAVPELSYDRNGLEQQKRLIDNAFSGLGREVPRTYAEGCQAGGDRTGKFLAPATATGIRLRNTLLSRRLFLNGMLRLGERVSSTVTLPDYPAGPSRVGR